MSIFGSMAKKNEEEKQKEVGNKTVTDTAQSESAPAAAEQEKTAPHPPSSAAIFNRMAHQDQKEMDPELGGQGIGLQEDRSLEQLPGVKTARVEVRTEEITNAASETKPSLTLDEPQLSQGKSGIVEQLEKDMNQKEPKQDLSLAELDEMHEGLQEDAAELILDIQDRLLELAARLKPISRTTHLEVAEVPRTPDLSYALDASPVFTTRTAIYNAGLKNKRSLVDAKLQLHKILTNLDY